MSTTRLTSPSLSLSLLLVCIACCADTADCAAPAGLMAVAVRVLWPRMRRRSGRFSGHGAPGSSRAAILNALTALQPPELATLLLLNVQPLGAALLPPLDVQQAVAPADAHDRCVACS